MPAKELLMFTIIGLVGLVTSYTDVKKRSIYNSHLIFGFIAGVIVLCFVMGVYRESLMKHFINGIVAVIVGFLFYNYKVWKGGDAKLYMLYSFLMPDTGYEKKFILTPIELFCSTFIVGSILVIPLLVSGSRDYWRRTIKRENLLRNLNELRVNIIGAFLFSWLLFPVLFLSHVQNHEIALVMTFAGWYAFRNQKIPLLRENIEIFMILVVGWLSRFILAPQMLSVDLLLTYVGRILIWGALFAFINDLLKNVQEPKTRIPFALFLFLGCILCYTSFLNLITNRH